MMPKIAQVISQTLAMNYYTKPGKIGTHAHLLTKEGVLTRQLEAQSTSTLQGHYSTLYITPSYAIFFSPYRLGCNSSILCELRSHFVVVDLPTEKGHLVGQQLPWQWPTLDNYWIIQCLSINTLLLSIASSCLSPISSIQHNVGTRTFSHWQATTF